MRRFALLLVLLLATIPVLANEKQNFTGSYQWDNGGTGKLTMELKPKGDDEWKVTYRFEWGGDKRSWKGTATGSLEDGTSVLGTAKWSGRNWRFEAEIVDGKMTGVHTEVNDKKSFKTGTFEVSRDE